MHMQRERPIPRSGMSSFLILLGLSEVCKIIVLLNVTLTVNYKACSLYMCTYQAFRDQRAGADMALVVHMPC